MSIIANMSNISNQFKAQMRLGTTNKNDYIESISTAVEQSWWDSIVAKLDSFLSHITNGSWSLSEKTVLIHKVDYFKKELINKLKTAELNNPEDIENFASSIDRKIFVFVMKNISTKPLTPDVNLCQKSEKGAVSVIQLNSTSGVLAEFPGHYIESLWNYDSNKAKDIPQELSQPLCTLMSLSERYYSWRRLHNDVTMVINDANNNWPIDAYTILADKYDDSLENGIKEALRELKCFVETNNTLPVDLSSYSLEPNNSFIKKVNSWPSIQEWSKAVNTDDDINNILVNMQNVKDDIYAILGTARF